LDATDPMMSHFLEGQMKMKSITFADVEKIMNNVPWIPEGATSFGFINDCRIIDGDIVCLNGYIHLLDKVLLPPGNMAEMIRSNGQTNYFSAMLDRFAAPYYNEQLTRQYKALNDIPADSIYEKRYISNRSQGGGKIAKRPDDLNFGGDQQFLPFDPGWNQYAVSSSTAKEQDMAAMFVPSDEAMINYFVKGGGVDLIQRYGTLPNTEENLLTNLYQIPLHLIQPLIQNLMKDSFNESVPSKYLTIVNDAQDQMFASYTSEEDYKSHIDKCILANNGVIYVTNTVDAPADYASVIAPALTASNTQIIRSVVRADDNFIEGSSYNNAPLKQYFSTYLKAMQSNFSFFVPVDEGLEQYGYVEPASFATQPFGAKSTNRYYWSFKYDDVTRGAVIPVEATAYNYNMSKGQQPGTDKKKGNQYVSKVTDNMSAGVGQQKRMNLIEMVDQHILVHDDPVGVNDARTYYLSRNGAPLRLTEKGTFEGKNVGMKVEGGYQVMINDPAEGYTENDHTAVVLEGYDKTQASNGYGNGMT
ncbi:MAG: fasciclin domain-containing protein, partial [Bacteroidaceae bacterium]|nr:fasciclin domain-containing protein [Bacteroidaceae bacterium]